MEIFISLLGLAILGNLGVTSLKCYSCDSDLTDLDCNDIKTLPKVNCSDVSDTKLVGLSCGFQKVKVGNSADRIFRGCMVAGECNLLNRQSELTSKYRMEYCQECSSENCNDMLKSGAAFGRDGLGLVHL